ncbi:MAG: AI-2E family transporter [Candidatus Fermentibacteraceae bacterium]|nr:AI-2E family transporter [Candidatus Fermentibacteraceae bacterium]MBN2608701.1 AI-2E family transporter [Candidatus Fermentibacteraceae bacterium]
MADNYGGRLFRMAIVLLGIVAAGMILKNASGVFVPLTVAFFLMLLLKPVSDRTAYLVDRTLCRVKGKFGREHVSEESRLAVIFSVMIVLLLFIFLSLGVYLLIRGQIELILSKGNEIMDNIVEPIKSWMVSSRLFGDAAAVSEYINNLAESAMSIAPNAARPIISGVFTFVMILVLTTFLMVGRRRLEDNLRNELKSSNFKRIMHISEKMESNTRKFIFTKLKTSSLTGLAIGLGLLLFLSPQDALTWGSICFVMNFIPIYGSLIAGAGAILYTMAVYEHGSFLDAWPVILIVMIVNNAVSNFIEPKLMQFSLPLGPVTVLLAVIIWAWLWGAWGMILAVPITILMKVMLEEINGRGWETAIMET